MRIIQFRYAVKEFQVLLYKTNNSSQHYSLVCTQLNGSTYCYISLTIQLSINHLFTQSLIVKQFYLTHIQDPIRATTPSQSEPGSNGNEEVLHISLSSRTRTSPSDGLMLHPGFFLRARACVWGVLALCSRCILQL